MFTSSTSFVIPVFNGKHYHIWVVKMRFYLRSQGLWNVVMFKADPPSLGANHIKDKTITCLHLGLANHIFTKIMDLKHLNSQNYERQRISKDYSSRLMDVVNQMRLLGKKFFKNNKGKTEGSSRKGNFSPCSHCSRTNHAEKDCWYKGKPHFNCNLCNKLGHNEKYYKNDDEHLFMASQALSSHELNIWLINGCTSHMTKHRSIYTSIDGSVQPKVKLGNGEVVRAKGKVTIAISTKRGTKIVTNVLYIPN
ncbi:hypothetical protein AAG906_029101 [Vitis piasezkii]